MSWLVLQKLHKAIKTMTQRDEKLRQDMNAGREQAESLRHGKLHM